jgi:geranylgeranyl diphosphate synthase type I
MNSGARTLKTIKTLQQMVKLIDPIMIQYLKNGADRNFIPIINYQVKTGGKRVRAALTILCCQACKGRIKDSLIPAAMIELIHNYSLIMDDIIDHGDLRRGLPTVRAKYGDPQALLAGMFYREIIGEMALDSTQPKEIHPLMVNAIKVTIEGERLDILCEQAGRYDQYMIKNRYQDVTPKLYFKIIKKKTAELIKAACMAGAISAKASKSYRNAIANYGEKIGLAFQVIDDFLDIFGEETGKQKGKDIIEHKLNNAAIVYALSDMDKKQRRRFVKILQKKELTKSNIGEAMTILESTNTKGNVLQLANDLINDAKKSLKVLPESSAKDDLEELADFVAARLY